MGVSSYSPCREVKKGDYPNISVIVPSSEFLKYNFIGWIYDNLSILMFHSYQ